MSVWPKLYQDHTGEFTIDTVSLSADQWPPYALKRYRYAPRIDLLRLVQTGPGEAKQVDPPYCALEMTVSHTLFDQMRGHHGGIDWSWYIRKMQEQEADRLIIWCEQLDKVTKQP